MSDTQSPEIAKLTAEIAALRASLAMLVAGLHGRFNYGSGQDWSDSTWLHKLSVSRKALIRSTIGRQQEAIATVFNIGSALANRFAEYMRRKDEWDHQATSPP